MNPRIEATEELAPETECELIELGEASEMTRGSFWGSSWDGGWGVRTP